jgi:hypothetical protein
VPAKRLKVGVDAKRLFESRTLPFAPPDSLIAVDVVILGWHGRLQVGNLQWFGEAFSNIVFFSLF